MTVEDLDTAVKELKSSEASSQLHDGAEGKFRPGVKIAVSDRAAGTCRSELIQRG